MKVRERKEEERRNKKSRERAGDAGWRFAGRKEKKMTGEERDEGGESRAIVNS